MKHRVILKQSVFPASRDRMWENLQQLATLQYIAKPFASFLTLDRAGDFLWQEGITVRLYLKLFCLIPFGTHPIHVIRFQKSAYEIYINEANRYVPVWNHKIVLRELEGGRTEYTDEVELYASWKTPFVYLWTNCFYAHRQKKWLKLL